MRRKKLTWQQYLAIGGLSVLLLCLLLMLWNIGKKEEVARKAAEDTKRELAVLHEREATLTTNLADLRSSRGQEASLRETYGVAKPGEEVIIVVSPPEEDELEALPWWRSFLGWFGL